MLKHIPLLFAAGIVASAAIPGRTFLPDATAHTLVTQTIQSAAAQPVPTELAGAIAALDAAASRRDLDTTIEFYAPTFVHGDGLSRDRMRESLKDLWQRYSQLRYRTEVTGWKRGEGNTFVVQTTTNVQGTRKDATQFALDARLTATQVYQNKDGKWQIVRQDILSERSSLASGEKPPIVELRLPDKIGVGRQYALDAIVTEPLGTSLLLGSVVEEPVSAENYLKDRTIDLEPLKAGGIFKIGQAPYSTGDRWISVVLIRENGITIAGQRLRISKDEVGTQYTPLPEKGSTPSRVRPLPNQRQSS